MTKRWISLVAVLAMMLGLLSGCGGASADKPAKLGSAGDFKRWFADGGRSLTKKQTPGSYYFQLTGDLTLDSTGVIDNGHQVFIDLNGYTITNGKGEAVQAFRVAEGAALTLTGGAMEMAGADQDGGLVYVDGGAVTLDGMTLTNRDDSGIAQERSGGVLYVTGQDPQTPGVLTVKGGTVINGSADGTRYSGGAVTLEGCSEMYLLDGTVQNGVAGLSGNVHMGGQSVLYMMGGLITGGQAKKSGGITGDGGNINITAQSRLCLYDGTISGGKAERGGGNIFISNYGKSEKQGFFQYGGTVEGGFCATKGGNLYAVDKTSPVCIYGGQIQNGEATYGGNVYLEAAWMELRGGTLTGLTGSNVNACGGNIYSVRGNIDMYDGTITGGHTKNAGGNVYIADGTIQLYGGSITHGKTFNTGVQDGGGNLYAGGKSVVTMYGGRISDGIGNAAKEDATTVAPNVMIAGHTVMHMFGGTIANGYLYGTTCRTGCVYVYGQKAGDDCVFHMYGGTMENGELEAEVMRGLAVGAYSVLADSSGIATGRIFDGEIVFTGDSDSPNRYYTIFGNKDGDKNMVIFNPDKYEGLYYRGIRTGPCPDESHNTQVQTAQATCLTPGYEQYHCDTCGDWYRITAQATGHNNLDVSVVEATALTPGYTENYCSDCDHLSITDVVLPAK